MTWMLGPGRRPKLFSIRATLMLVGCLTLGAAVTGCATFSPAVVQAEKAGAPNGTGVLDSVTPPRLLLDDGPNPALPRATVSGRVTLSLDVDETGAVTDAQIVSYQKSELVRPALAAARRLQFSPGLFDGRPAPFRNVPVTLVYTDGAFDSRETKRQASITAREVSGAVANVVGGVVRIVLCIGTLGLAC